MRRLSMYIEGSHGRSTAQLKIKERRPKNRPRSQGIGRETRVKSVRSHGNDARTRGSVSLHSRPIATRDHNPIARAMRGLEIELESWSKVRHPHLSVCKSRYSLQFNPRTSVPITSIKANRN
uniref:Protein kinase domain-containing protein n=1 Tax=Bursaphelenchus xylophilus TaxID=6326 RepID=A0A1I7ST23_BURXY